MMTLQMMINFDDITKNTRAHIPIWLQVPNDPYVIPIIGSSGLEKTNALLKLINHQKDIDKICLYVKDPYKTKY